MAAERLAHRTLLTCNLASCGCTAWKRDSGTAEGRRADLEVRWYVGGATACILPWASTSLLPLDRLLPACSMALRLLSFWLEVIWQLNVLGSPLRLPLIGILHLWASAQCLPLPSPQHFSCLPLLGCPAVPRFAGSCQVDGCTTLPTARLMRGSRAWLSQPVHQVWGPCPPLRRQLHHPDRPPELQHLGKLSNCKPCAVRLPGILPLAWKLRHGWIHAWQLWWGIVASQDGQGRAVLGLVHASGTGWWLSGAACRRPCCPARFCREQRWHSWGRGRRRLWRGHDFPEGCLLQCCDLVG